VLKFKCKIPASKADVSAACVTVEYNVQYDVSVTVHHIYIYIYKENVPT